MTKLNNKGVSLIDCLIAVAVLAILVSPIISQLYTTVQVSAKAKEEQYVIDDANQIYEVFRKTKDEDLVVNLPVDDKKINNVFDNTSINKHQCILCDSTGTPINYTGVIPAGSAKDASVVSTNPLTVEYKYKIYTMENEKLGRASTEYNRYVVWSDLKNIIYELGYQVDYNEDSVAGFTKRSDNAFVVAGNGSDLPAMTASIKSMLIANTTYNDALVDKIVVEERTNLPIDSTNETYIMDMKNPNDVDIGNVQDIDSTKVAIIPGEATLLDYELEKELRKDLMNFGASHPDSYIYDDLDDVDALYDDIKTILESGSTKKTRQIHIEITCGKNESGTPDVDENGKPNFYHVNCDVSYRLDFGGSELTLFNGGTSVVSGAEDFKYRVLENDYYTDTPPDVYFVYEPLLNRTAVGTDKIINYADNDFITITTDKYTSAVNKKVDDFNESDSKTTFVYDDPSRIYLIKSSDNFAKEAGALGNTTFEDYYSTLSDTQKENYDPTAFYTVRGGSYQLVNINVNRDVVSTSLPAEQGILDIYTNISKKNLDVNVTGANRLYTKNGFSVDAAGYSAKPVFAQGSKADYDADHIKRVDREEGNTDNDRLAQFTVVYQKASSPSEVIYISGARGADR